MGKAERVDCCIVLHIEIYIAPLTKPIRGAFSLTDPENVRLNCKWLAGRIRDCCV